MYKLQEPDFIRLIRPESAVSYHVKHAETARASGALRKLNYSRDATRAGPAVSAV